MVPLVTSLYLVACLPSWPEYPSPSVDSAPVLDDIDEDNDGYSIAEGDCDDDKAAINPAATDLVGDDIDQNCDGVDGMDGDQDGFASEASGGEDCDDEDEATYPGAAEVPWDGIDQDCDGTDWMPYSAVSAGGDHSCALDPSGGIECWGGNSYGQVSDAP